MVFQPLLSQIEENLVLAGVEFARNVDGASDIVPKLVVVNWRCRRGKAVGVGIARPSIRVQGGVPQIFVGRAMELARAGLGGKTDLRAGSAAVFRSIVGGKNLHLLRGVNVCGPQASAVGACAGSWSTVEGDKVFWIARTVEVRRTLGEAEVEIGQRCPSSTWHQRREPNGVAAIELERVNLLAGNEFLHGCGFRL